MTKGVHHRVNLHTAFLRSAERRFPTALGGTRGESRVDDAARGLRVPSLLETQHLSQIMNHVLEAVMVNPAFGLLLDDLPRWEIMGEVTVLRASAEQVTKCVVDFA